MLVKIYSTCTARNFCKTWAGDPEMFTETLEYSAVFSTQFRKNLSIGSDFTRFRIFQCINTSISAYIDMRQELKFFAPS